MSFLRKYSIAIGGVVGFLAFLGVLGWLCWMAAPTTTVTTAFEDKVNLMQVKLASLQSTVEQLNSAKAAPVAVVTADTCNLAWASAHSGSKWDEYQAATGTAKLEMRNARATLQRVAQQSKSPALLVLGSVIGSPPTFDMKSFVDWPTAKGVWDDKKSSCTLYVDSEWKEVVATTTDAPFGWALWLTFATYRYNADNNGDMGDGYDAAANINNGWTFLPGFDDGELDRAKETFNGLLRSSALATSSTWAPVLYRWLGSNAQDRVRANAQCLYNASAPSIVAEFSVIKVAFEDDKDENDPAFGSGAANEVYCKGWIYRRWLDLGPAMPAQIHSALQSFATGAGFVLVQQPMVVAISPPSVPVAGDVVITITGANLQNATVMVDGDECTELTAVPAGLTCKVPAEDAGAKDVVVTTPGGSSLPKPITYVDPPAAPPGP